MDLFPRWSRLSSADVSLPGVCLRRGTAWAGEDHVDRGECVRVECELESPQRCAVELSHRARTDDRIRHAFLREHPREAHRRRLLAELGAQRFPIFQLRADRIRPSSREYLAGSPPFRPCQTPSTAWSRPDRIASVKA